MESKKDVYPVNSTARPYQDADGNPTTLYRLVRNEPDWAMSRIKDGELAIAQRDELLAALVDCRENAGTPELVYRRAREAIAKCEVKS